MATLALHQPQELFGDDAYRRSPLVHTVGITQPVLLGHYDRDANVPIGQAEWFARRDEATTLQVVTGPGSVDGFTHAAGGVTEESWRSWLDAQEALLSALARG